MARLSYFRFQASAEEWRIINALAEYLHRSQSDAVRWLIRNAAAELNAAASGAAPNILVQADTVIIQYGAVNQASMGDITTGGDVTGRDKITTKNETPPAIG